jgi:lysophospholipase L1-like esterase
MLSSLLLPALALMGTADARPHSPPRGPPPAFFLAGDSTTAPAGGWGDAFVASLTKGSTGINFGHSGATTSSFRADGDWDQVIESVRNHTKTHRPFVTIQFGHNDQKTEEGLAVFLDNLVQFDEEVRAAGGEPIFLTSLERRRFTSNGTIEHTLDNVVALTIEAAGETGARWADLNAASRAYLEAIGPENSATYNLDETDRTHLNDAGGVVFAGLVGLLLEGLEPSFAKYIGTDPELEAALEAGEYYYPE